MAYQEPQWSYSNYRRNALLPRIPVILAPFVGGTPTEPVAVGSIISDYPVETDVRDGVTYGNSSYVGNMTEPLESDVANGVQYGANGTEFTGTLVGGTGGESAHTFVM